MEAEETFREAMLSAETRWRAGELAAAQGGFEQIARIFPAQAEPCADLGWIALTGNDPSAAHYWFCEALARRPDHLRAQLGAGQALLELGQPNEALPHYRAARPAAEAFYGEGEALTQLGDFDRARTAFTRAAGQQPDCVRYHYALSQCGPFTAEDPRLVPLRAMALRAEQMAPHDQVLLHFALARAEDDLGHNAAAWQHWQAGNAMAHTLCPYDEATALGLSERMISAFSEDFFRERRGNGHESAQPVFIIGMPRSGTTLVEQILASHRDVYGAGETTYLPNLIGANLAGTDFPDHIADLSGADFKRLGGFYLARLATEIPPESETAPRRITDKLPANFLLAGLIHLMLPNARILHICRDPVDTCFSCYTNLFSQDIDYSYDLGTLGRYYRSYARLMAHWHRLLPEDRLTDIHYEDLVLDPEATIRRMVAFCGLDWDPACLNFSATRRVIHTLSARQVRRPMYHSAIGRARPYQQHLQTLISALNEKAE